MSALLGFSLIPEINFQRFSLIKKLYRNDLVKAWQELSMADLRRLGFKLSLARDILQQKNKLDLESYQAKLLQKNVKIIEVDSDDYPAILREIYDPPLVLHQLGELNISLSKNIAVVGTRKPTPYGLNATKTIIKELADIQCCIVSGLASGIDAAAHWSALENELPTIAVLGTGVDRVYPYENKKLFKAIIENGGAIVSEYPLDSVPLPWHFPRRNRIITGLCKATLVIEGNVKSGALISGKLALDQNRDIYALPGNIYSEMSSGPNWLIEQGSKPLLSAQQIKQEVFFQNISLFHNTKPQKIVLNSQEKVLYNMISSDGNLTIDDLIDESSLNYCQVTSNLLALELKGLVAQLPGKRIMRL